MKTGNSVREKIKKMEVNKSDQKPKSSVARKFSQKRETKLSKHEKSAEKSLNVGHRENREKDKRFCFKGF